MRSVGTTYTNTTGKPIQISVMQQNVDGAAAMYVSGVRVCNWGDTASAPAVRYYIVGTCSAIVPPGESYFVTGWTNPVWHAWLELR
jgi:hypothetical protein